MEKNQVDDRRKFIRIPVQLNARYSEENKEEWHECFAINISHEGMGVIVYSRNKIKLDSVLQLEIVVPIKKDPISITGTLMWIKKLKENPKFNFIGGIKIITIDSEDKRTLLDSAYDEQFRITEEVMKCKNCGKPTIRSEVDENEGNCPNCNEKFQFPGGSS